MSFFRESFIKAVLPSIASIFLVLAYVLSYESKLMLLRVPDFGGNLKPVWSENISTHDDKSQSYANDPFRSILARYSYARFHVLHDGTNNIINDYGSSSAVTTISPVRSDDAKKNNRTTDVIHVYHGLESLPDRLVCNNIVYTAHDGVREVDRELDSYRRAWAMLQNRVCMFVIQVDANATRSSNIPPQIRRRWRRRTRHDPIILVERYKAGLVLMALVQQRKIVSEDDEFPPWILYVDGDSMFANKDHGIRDVLDDVALAANLPTAEDQLCYNSRDDHSVCPLADDIMLWDTPRRYKYKEPRDHALILSYSLNCHRGHNALSGALLFRSSRLAGFIFDALANSPTVDIDTKQYLLGDQAVLDWLLSERFNIDWIRQRKLCVEPWRSRVFKPSCERHRVEFLFERSYNDRHNAVTVRELDERRDAGNDTSKISAEELFLESLEAKWRPQDEGSMIGFVCVRWFNAPGCPKYLIPRRYREFQAFRCGDLLWHLYGCRKDSWKQPSSALYNLLLTPECQVRLPLPFPSFE